MNTLQILNMVRSAEFDLDFFIVNESFSAAVEEYKEFSDITHTRHIEAHRVELIASASECVLDLTSGVGYVIKNILVESAAKVGLNVALGFVSLAIDLIALGKQSYVTHQARMCVRQTKKEIAEVEQMEISTAELEIMLAPLLKKLEEQREDSFKNKVKVAYRTLYAVSSLIIALSFVCPPLLLVGGGLLLTTLAVEHIDTKNNYKISRYFQDLGNRLANAIHASYDRVVSAVKNDFSFFKSPKTDLANDESIEMSEVRVGLSA
ncbi:MAG: hypothetical protein SFW66_01160 [Gammaproteobacteria bacterium]|nr:hypothetical protein [Gammaproteobacteria bacterium]